MQRSIQQRRIDIALVIRAVHRGAWQRERLRRNDAVPDAAEGKPEPDADVAKDVQMARPSKQDRQQHAGRGDDRDVNGDGDECEG